VSWLALGCFCAFLAVVFPLRAVRQRARFGRRPPMHRPRPAAFLFADALVSTGFLLAAAGPALDAFAIAETAQPGAPAMGVAGVTIVLAAIALAVWAQEAMGSAWRTDIAPDADAGLVTGGPFAYARNPTYDAMLAATAGVLLIAFGVLGAAGLAVLLTGLMRTARLEERRLALAFGVAYRSYAARVGRFVPGVGRLSGSGSR